MAGLRAGVRGRPRRGGPLSAPAVLFLSPVARLGGAELSLLDLAAALGRAGFAPRILCLGDGPLVDEARRMNVTVEPVAPSRLFTRTSLRGARTGGAMLALGLLGALPLVAAIGRAARRCDAAVLHSNGNKTHLLSVLVRRRPGVRLVWHVRDLLPERAVERGLVGLANRRADALVANSRAVADRLRRLGARPGLVHAVPNGIDLERFTPRGAVADLRGEFGWPAATRLVGLVAHLAPWKGHAVFLRAARLVGAHHPETRFVLVGAEIYQTRGHAGFERRLRALRGELGLDATVAFAGERRDVPEILRALDVVVHASTDPEPFGRILVEALACERPIVSCRGGGVDEILEGLGMAALSVEGGDAAALARAVEVALDDPARAAGWALEGRLRVAALFGLAQHARAMTRLYAALGVSAHER